MECPFCDGENTELYSTKKQKNETTRYYKCKDCRQRKEKTRNPDIKTSFSTIELRRCDYELLGEMERLAKTFRK